MQLQKPVTPVSCEPSGGRSVADPPALFGTVSIDVQGLAAFRIFIAAIMLYDFFADLLPVFKDLMGPGLLYSAGYIDGTVFWSLFPESLALQYSVLAVYVVALLLLLIGWRARSAAFVVFVIYAGIMSRNTLLTNNADVLLRALLLWSSFLPIAHCWSVDSALRDGDQQNTRWPVIPVVAIKLQIAVIYFCSGMFKLAGQPWLEGKAVFYTMADQLYGTSLGAQTVALASDSVLFLLTWAITIFQLLFSILVYVPGVSKYGRPFALIGAVVMHISFILFMRINIFPFVCLAYLFILVPDAWFDKALTGRRARLKDMKIFYDSDCGFCRATSRIFREFCLTRQVQVLPASDDPKAQALLKKHDSWVVYGADGAIYLKWRAVSYILRQSPLFYIFGVMTDLAVFERVYNLIGRNRLRLSKIFRIFLTPHRDLWPDVTAQGICGVLALVMVFYTFMSLPQSPFSPPPNLQLVAKNTGLDQVWSIFAPETAAYIREYTVKGYDVQGKPVDLSSVLSLQYSRDSAGYYRFRNHRWQRYSTYFNSKGVAEGYGKWLCDNAEADLHHLRLLFAERHKYKETVRWNKGLDYDCLEGLNRDPLEM